MSPIHLPYLNTASMLERGHADVHMRMRVLMRNNCPKAVHARLKIFCQG